MKLLFRTSLIFTLLLLGAHTALACSCVMDSMEKRFRKAKAVFIGRAVEDEPQDQSLIQKGSNEDNASQTVEAVKSFKGIRKRFINITFDKETLKGASMCPTLYFLMPNKEYLVFAYGKSYQVRTVCSDTWEIPGDKNSPMYEQMQGYIKKLGSFWFRFRARLNLF